MKQKISQGIINESSLTGNEFNYYSISLYRRLVERSSSYKTVLHLEKYISVLAQVQPQDCLLANFGLGQERGRRRKGRWGEGRKDGRGDRRGIHCY